MRRHTASSIAAALVYVSAAAPAAADNGRTSSLSWVVLPGAEACGGAVGIGRAVEELLGRPALVSPAHADLSIEGHAEPAPPGFRALLVVRDATGAQLGVRDLKSDSPDCRELRDNVALAVALMIDPDAVAHRPPPPPAPPPRVIVERVEVPIAAAPRASWEIEPAAAAAVGYGFMPSASWGAEGTVVLRPSRLWPVEVSAGFWATQDVAAERPASARFTSAYGAIGVCPLHVLGGRVSFELCPAVRVGVISSEPSGFSTSQGGSLPTVHLAGDAHLSITLIGPLAVRAGGGLAAALRRAQFVFRDSAGAQSLYDMPLLAATADVGLSVTVP